MKLRLGFFCLLLTILLASCAPGGGSPGGFEPGVTDVPSETFQPVFGPIVPVGDPIPRVLDPSDEIVPNCSGTTEPVKKNPAITAVTGHAVEWQVGGQFGTGVQIGQPYLPVAVDLSVVLDVADRTELQQGLQQQEAWELPAAPGEIVVYKLGWEELWQPASLDITFGDNTVRTVDVTYRTGIRSQILSADRRCCEGVACNQEGTTQTNPGFIATVDDFVPPTPLVAAVQATAATSVANSQGNQTLPSSRWLEESIYIPTSGSQLSRTLSPGQVMILTGGQFQYGSQLCGGDVEQICVLLYEATFEQSVTVDGVIAGNNYIGITDSLSQDEIIAEKRVQFWLPPNCIDGCQKATVFTFKDGVLVESPFVIQAP